MELATLRAKHAALAPVLTERSRRVWAATEAQAIGYGGTALVARATGIATSTIQRGLRELTADEPLAGGRTRRAGGGRKRAIDLDATLLRDLDALVEPTAPGDPDSPLRWTCQSARTLAVALDGLGHRVSHTVVAELLHGLGYSLQGNAKTREGRQHVDRDAQFRYIARRVRRAQRQQQPTISVDTKKKELVGAFKNAGRTWRPAKTPQRVQVHDFVIPATATTGGKAIPYGIYDLHRNEGWVSVGIDHDVNGNRKPHICGNRKLHTPGEDVSGGADILPVMPVGRVGLDAGSGATGVQPNTRREAAEPAVTLRLPHAVRPTLSSASADAPASGSCCPGC